MKYLNIFFFCLFSSFLQAQESRLLVIDNDNHGKDITYEQKKRLTERLKSIFEASNNGNTNQVISIFAVRPYFEVTEFQKAEGLKTKVVCNTNLRLTLINLITQANAGEVMIAFQGIGDDKNTAINQAVGAIKGSNINFKKFLTQSQTNIADYYTKECDNALEQAKQQMTLNNPAEAAIIAGSIPQNATCYQKAQTLKQQALLQYQQNNCKNLVVKADAAVAANEFKNALFLLSQIDASSPCAEDVKTRIASIETKVDDKNKEDFDWFFKAYATGAEMQTAQNKVYQEILTSYFRNVKGINVY